MHSSKYSRPCRYIQAECFRLWQFLSRVNTFRNQLNPLKPNGNYMYHLHFQSITLHFVFMGFAWFSLKTAIISLNSIKKFIFVMVKCGIFFSVRTEFLNIILTSFGFKGLIEWWADPVIFRETVMERNISQHFMEISGQLYAPADLTLNLHPRNIRSTCDEFYVYLNCYFCGSIKVTPLIPWIILCTSSINVTF
jgi:hypothetical protein